MAVNWSDPCERATRLREAYYRILGGEQEERVRYSGNGVERETVYTKTHLDTLIAEIRNAEAECAASQGQPVPRQRFAIQAGSRRVL